MSLMITMIKGVLYTRFSSVLKTTCKYMTYKMSLSAILKNLKIYQWAQVKNQTRNHRKRMSTKMSTTKMVTMARKMRIWNTRSTLDPLNLTFNLRSRTNRPLWRRKKDGSRGLNGLRLSSKNCKKNNPKARKLASGWNISK